MTRVTSARDDVADLISPTLSRDASQRSDLYSRAPETTRNEASSGSIARPSSDIDETSQKNPLWLEDDVDV